MLDFSNSIILMVLLGQYLTFVETYIYPSAEREQATNNFMYANIVVSILLFLLSPPIGVFIDRYYIRVPIVIVSVVGYSVMSMALYGVQAGDKIRPICMYAFAMFFFRLNEMVSGAFLPSLCNDRDMGFVSSFGYFLGFLSGVIINLVCKLFTTPPADYTEEEKAAYRITGYSTTMMVTGIIQLLSGLPPMLSLDNGIPEGEKRPKLTRRSIPDSFKENASTIKNSFKINRTLTSILLCYILVSVGAQTFVSFGSLTMCLYAAEYGFTLNDMQNCGLYYNCGVGVFSLIFAFISKVASAYVLVLISFVIIIVGCCVTFWYRELEWTDSFNPGFFWVWLTFVLFSISVGPLQALIRGSIGFLTPDEKKGEIFGCLESMIILGNILGSTIPSLLIYLNYWAFFLWITVFFVIATIVWIFIPVRAEEKKALARIKEREAKEEAEKTKSISSGEEIDVVVRDESSSGSGSSSSKSISDSSSQEKEDPESSTSVSVQRTSGENSGREERSSSDKAGSSSSSSSLSSSSSSGSSSSN